MIEKKFRIIVKIDGVETDKVFNEDDAREFVRETDAWVDGSETTEAMLDELGTVADDGDWEWTEIL